MLHVFTSWFMIKKHYLEYVKTLVAQGQTLSQPMQ